MKVYLVVVILFAQFFVFSPRYQISWKGIHTEFNQQFKSEIKSNIYYSTTRKERGHTLQ